MSQLEQPKINQVLELINGTIKEAKKQKTKDSEAFGNYHYSISRWDSFINGLETAKGFIVEEFEK